MRKNLVQGARCKVKRTCRLNPVPSTLRRHGFTLIEVLIAMTLLSIMVVLLFSSLKICADSWEKGESKMTDVNEVAVVYNFFQRHLSATLPLWKVLSKEEKIFAFQGKAHSLQFISAFPASAGRSGLQLFSLYRQKEDNEQVINVTLTPFAAAVEGEERHKEEVTLIKHVSDFTLTYFGTEDGENEGGWVKEWLEKSALPRLVKINIKLDNGIFWQEMIIDLKVTGSTGNADLEPGIINDTNDSQNIDEPEAVE